MTSLAHAKVAIPLPAGAVEVNARAALGHSVGSGTTGPSWMPLTTWMSTRLRRGQFQVLAKGVHRRVKRFDDRGKGGGTPVGPGTRITNANVGPSAKAPANATIDLAKFREPDVPKKGERGENVHYAASAACTHGSGAAAAAATWEETKAEEEGRTRTATAQVAKCDSEYE